MRRKSIMSVLVASLCLPSILMAADWSQFRGPSANGFAPDKGINKTWNEKAPKTLWKVTLSDGGYAGPSVAGGKVFIIDHEGKNDIVRAIDIATGKDVWKYTYEDTDEANYGFARSTPTVSEGNVYALSRLGLLNCLNAKTGKVVWTRDIIKDFSGKRPGWDLAYSPFIDGNKVIVLPGGPDAAVVALDKKTGKTLWQGGGSDTPSYSTPIKATIQGKAQYVIFNTPGLAGIDPADGKVLWTSAWKTGCDCNAAAPVMMGNAIFITSGYGHGCSVVDVNPDGAKTRWENKEIQAHFNSSVFYQNYIYGTGDPGNLVCLDPQTGKVMWKQAGFEKGGLVAVDGTIIVADGKSGDIVMVSLSPDGYKELGRIKPLGGQTWTAPIVANGNLIVRNTTGLACVSLK